MFVAGCRALPNWLTRRIRQLRLCSNTQHIGQRLRGSRIACAKVGGWWRCPTASRLPLECSGQDVELVSAMIATLDAAMFRLAADVRFTCIARRSTFEWVSTALRSWSNRRCIWMFGRSVFAFCNRRPIGSGFCFIVQGFWLLMKRLEADPVSSGRVGRKQLVTSSERTVALFSTASTSRQCNDCHGSIDSWAEIIPVISRRTCLKGGDIVLDTVGGFRFSRILMHCTPRRRNAALIARMRPRSLR